MENVRSKHLSKGKIKQRGYWQGSHYISKSNTGHWSKYGGARYEEIVDLPIWTCQSCQELQSDCLPSYLLQHPENEYIKICVMCRYVVIRHDLKTFDELITMVRRTNLFTVLANLLTLPLAY